MPSLSQLSRSVVIRLERWRVEKPLMFLLTKEMIRFRQVALSLQAKLAIRHSVPGIQSDGHDDLAAGCGFLIIK